MGGMHIEDGMSSGSHRCDVRLLLAITEPSNNKEPTSRDGLSQRGRSYDRKAKHPGSRAVTTFAPK